MRNISTSPFFLIFMLLFCSTSLMAQKRKILKLQNQAKTYYDQKEYNSAIKFYDKALKKGQATFDILYYKGMSNFYLKEYQAAINNFDLATKINAENDEIYFIKGQTYDRLKDYEKAISAFQEALKYAPKEKHASLYNCIGNDFLTIGKHKECIKAYQMAIELDEANKDYYYNLAKGYSAIGNYEKAIETHKITIRLDPKYTKSYSELGANYLMMKKYHQAIKMIEKALENTSELENKFYSYNNLALSYLNINMLDKAILYAEKSKKLDSDNHYIYFTLAGIAAFKKDREGFYNELIKADALGFSLENRLDEPFLRPYLQEERFKSFLK